MPEWKRWLVDHYRGTLYFDSGRYHEAERMFRSSVSQNPESTSPWIWLASSLAEQEKFEDAVDVLSGAVELEGDRDEVYLNMAYSLRTLGKLQEAKDCLTKALVITADYSAALEELTDVNAALDAIQGM